jgi:hypothetical protein
MSKTQLPRFNTTLPKSEVCCYYGNSGDTFNSTNQIIDTYLSSSKENQVKAVIVKSAPLPLAY